ncbi:MAG TPA: efflux RND transporter periplasmic adaptor subunit [Bacillales bacterium]|nr:efflux RND transporter periplasmic adaptor subunit [Bacillales bacterium]
MNMEIERKRRWPKVLAWMGVVLFIAATVGANVYKMRTETAFAPEALKTTVVKGKTMSETMIVSGQVVPADIARFYKDPSKGEVALLVQEGDKVQKGDVLYRYEGAGVNTQLDSLELQKERIHMQMNHNDSRIEELEDQISDVEDKDWPQEQIDSQVDQLEAQIDELAFQNQLSEIDLEKVNLQVEQAQNQLNGLVVKSEMAGIVRSVAEEPYNTQGTLVTVVSGGTYEIRGTLSEYDAVRVKKGQAVEVRAKALSDTQWSGKVAEIGKLPVQQQTTATGQQSVAAYPFTITLKGNENSLRSGFHVTAEITVDQHENVPAVPFNAILTQGDQSYVFVIRNGELDRRLIETGLVNGKAKEVTKGIKIGARIVLHPTSELEEGMVISHDQTP